jgi:hypothetical protein
MCQDYSARIAPVQFNTTDQDGVTLSDTYGESIVSSGVQQDVVLVSGYYPGLLMDSTTSVSRVMPDIDGLSAFPNPVSAATILQLERSHAPFEVTLFSQDGRRLNQWVWPEDEQHFQLSFDGLAASGYFIVVSDRKLNQRSVLQIIRR